MNKTFRGQTAGGILKTSELVRCITGCVIVVRGRDGKEYLVRLGCHFNPSETHNVLVLCDMGETILDAVLEIVESSIKDIQQAANYDQVTFELGYISGALLVAVKAGMPEDKALTLLDKAKNAADNRDVKLNYARRMNLRTAQINRRKP